MHRLRSFCLTASILCLEFVCGWLPASASEKATATASISTASATETARRHNITYPRPATDFFEGAVLGNGAMGVVVRTRPDAVILHFGHNNVWDIRVTERYADRIGTFAEIFAKAAAMPDSLPSIHHDPFFADYLNITADNYRSPYPRPFPCGSLILGLDRTATELLGHTVDISNGRCTVEMLHRGEPVNLLIDVSMASDDVMMSLVDGAGNPVPSCFNRVRLLPDPSNPGELPHYQLTDCTNRSLGFIQQLPAAEDCTPGPDDKAFALRMWSDTPLTTGVRHTIYGAQLPLGPLERYIDSDSRPFYMMTSLAEGSKADVLAAVATPLNPSIEDWARCFNNNQQAWRQYWDAASVQLADEELERMWYRNMYFFNCAVRPGVICPGIFANWSYSNIGTAWHGDYHLNYNTQQPFWLTFSSNHLDKNLVYADLVEHLMPLSTQWARDYYGMRGAFFPHSAYPVTMNMHPYPVPDWGWEVFETPWMVQGLWWHYLYSGDTDFLRDRAFTPIKAATEFLVDYMSRPEARNGRFDDGKYHIFPSVPPELYGLQPGFKYNYDTQIDITLARHIFNAYLEAVKVLGIDKKEKALTTDVRKILDALPSYSTATNPDYGTVLTSVPGERGDIVYNVPANLAVVFPGNEYGLHSPDSIKELTANTIRAHKNEGGNEIVFLNMQKARMGMLDLDAFKRQVRYATLPDATVTDAVLETGGRYDDLTDFKYMAPMGIWFENFALPAVINECLMQSYDGVIELFPNWPGDVDARFNTLRARGAFLISATLADGKISHIEILSEKGNPITLAWPPMSVATPTDAASIESAAAQSAAPPTELAHAPIKSIDAPIEIVTSTGKTIKATPHNGRLTFPTTPGITYTILPN